ncbi:MULTISPECIES: response regulator transcription factor [Clostridium]|uniref:Stage 0 sporulation protein A homolog n=2 Tax=Clostridium TaxID=1485 RepID=A0A151AL55_9CLOT|nr:MULTISPECIES: response regulator transcription factor [Clostridium]KYH28345.1 transcriptional regulatory protein YycF [Clostridium colicanis DSM 13634]MBE6043599.1 response regulator transcription factor [Clostridium thermopalmarium]PRR68787.1 Transcriptional regulatory protein YycF [Clostridium thermopalmarium DSM 5974]PVZ22630.1 DNA-binding response OmpR family regulator [Clostridium thermopalmarium DSM 5974]
MYRLLLVEDDKALSMGIEFTLKDEGYEVITAYTLEEGIYMFNKDKFDLVILDVNLPDGSGYNLCKHIRSKSDIPVIFLTALDEEVNVVLGFEMGGDDYITKPFRVKELLLRIRAILRRNSKAEASGNKLISGDIIVDTSMALVKKKGQEVSLTAQEYRLLLIFMSKGNAVIKREEILKELIESKEVFFDENTLSVYIKRIREKIEDNSKNPEYIVTVRGLGYKWNKEVVKE